MCHDELLTHRFDVHERAAVREPELAVRVVMYLVPEVHELWGRADVELHALEDRRDVVVAGVAEELLHPAGVDRTRAHPLLDRDVSHRIDAQEADDLGHSRTVDEVTG